MPILDIPAALSPLGSLPTTTPPSGTLLSESLRKLFSKIPYSTVGNFNADPYNDLAGQAKNVAGLQGTPYDQQVANNQLPLAQSESNLNFLQNNAAPVMATHDYLPTPNHAVEPLPQRGVDQNELIGNLAAGLLGMSGAHGLDALVPGLQQRGQYLDERAHNDQLTQYQQALNRDNAQYGDAANSRQAQLAYQEHNDATNFANAQALYGHGAQLAQAEGTAHGLSNAQIGLTGLQDQAQNYNVESSGLNNAAQIIQAKLAHEALQRQEYNNVLSQYMGALKHETDATESGARAGMETSRGHMFEASGLSSAAQTAIDQLKLPYQIRALDQEYNTSSQLLPWQIFEKRANAQAALIGANSGVTNSQANMLNALTNQKQAQTQGSDALDTKEQNAALRIIKVQTQPYQDMVDEAQKEADKAAKTQNDNYQYYMVHDPTFAAAITNPPANGSKAVGTAQRMMKPFVDANKVAQDKLETAKSMLRGAQAQAQESIQKTFQSNKILGGQGLQIRPLVPRQQQTTPANNGLPPGIGVLNR